VPDAAVIADAVVTARYVAAMRFERPDDDPQRGPESADPLCAPAGAWARTTSGRGMARLAERSAAEIGTLMAKIGDTGIVSMLLGDYVEELLAAVGATADVPIILQDCRSLIE
jgi:hypothetical protein